MTANRSTIFLRFCGKIYSTCSLFHIGQSLSVFLTLSLAACQGSRAGNQYHIFLWHGVVLTRVVLDLGTSKEQVHKKLNSPESVLAPDTFHILSPFTFSVARCYELGMNYIKLLISGFCF